MSPPRLDRARAPVAMQVLLAVAACSGVMPRQPAPPDMSPMQPVDPVSTVGGEADLGRFAA